ncbi:hypothetical protein D3C81_1646050 [compost metagenome]
MVSIHCRSKFLLVCSRSHKDPSPSRRTSSLNGSAPNVNPASAQVIVFTLPSTVNTTCFRLNAAISWSSNCKASARWRRPNSIPATRVPDGKLSCETYKVNAPQNAVPRSPTQRKITAKYFFFITGSFI